MNKINIKIDCKSVVTHKRINTLSESVFLHGVYTEELVDSIRAQIELDEILGYLFKTRSLEDIIFYLLRDKGLACFTKYIEKELL